MSSRLRARRRPRRVKCVPQHGHGVITDVKHISERPGLPARNRPHADRRDGDRDPEAAVAVLRREGQIRHLGVSHVDEARSIARVAAVQSRFHIHDRKNAEVLARCERDGIAYVPYFPLGGGRARLDTARRRHRPTAAEHRRTMDSCRNPGQAHLGFRHGRPGQACNRTSSMYQQHDDRVAQRDRGGPRRRDGHPGHAHHGGPQHPMQAIAGETR
ncbi:aldo/keto reductase [Nonomuraea sp. NPDC004297]